MLKAEVQASKPINSFDDVRSQAAYQALDARTQYAVAMEYFEDRAAKNPEYKKLAPEAQEASKQDFISHYQIPMPDRQPITTGQGFQHKARPGVDYKKGGFLGDLSRGLGAVNLYAGAVVDPFVNTFTFGLASSPQEIEEDYRRQFPGIENDSGFLGQAYQAHQNRYANLVGGALGGFGGLKNTQGILGGLGVGGKALFPASILTFSGGSNTVGALKGEQTPLEATGNTALDFALSPLGGKTVFGNAIVQALAGGAGGAGSSLLQDYANNQPFDWDKAKLMAAEQAVLGAGMGAAFTPPMTKKPALTGRVIAEGASYGDFGPSLGTYNRKSKKLTTNSQAKNKLVDRIVELHQAGKTNEAGIMVREITRRLSAQNGAVFRDQINARLKQAKASVKPTKKALDPQSGEFQNVVDFIAALRKTGKAKEADVALGQFEIQTKAKIYDTVRAAEARVKAERVEANQAAKDRAKAASERVKQQQVEAKQRAKELSKLEAESRKQQAQLEAKAKSLKDLKARQAVSDQIAFEKAQSKERQRELNRLRGEIINRSKEITAQEKAERVEANQAAKVEQKTSQTQTSKLKLIRKAISKKQVVRLVYEAEKTGETGSYRFKDVSPYEVNVNKNGVVQVRAINAEGQFRTYLLSDASGSKILSVEATNKTSPFEIFTNEKGKLQVKQAAGETIEQIQREGVKSSELRANIEKMEDVLRRLKQNENVSIRDITNAVKDTNEKQFVEKLPDDKMDKVSKEVDCQ